METSLSPDYLLKHCRSIPSEKELVLHAANEFIGLMLTCYPSVVAKLARKERCQQAVIRWTGCKRAFEVPAAFADEAEVPDVQEIRDFNQRYLPTPRSRNQQILLEATLNDKPTGIVTIRSGKVVFMNDLMPAFVGLPPDEIIVPDIYDLFREKEQYTPDDPNEFNQRLKENRVLVGSLTAFRTNGDFGAFIGTYRHDVWTDVPLRGDRTTELEVRISEYDRFELIKRFA